MQARAGTHRLPVDGFSGKSSEWREGAWRMVALQRAHLRTENGTLILTLKLDPAAVPPAPLQVQLALHDDVAIIWQASFGCQRNGDVWEGRLGWQPVERRRLLEIAQLHDAAGNPIELVARRLFLEPPEDGEWASGVPAEAERLRLEKARKARFEVPLVHSEAKHGDPIFTVIMLADNVLLTREQSLPGLHVLPLLRTTLGTDIVDVLNAVLGQLGFQGGIDPSEWVQQMRRRRPAIILHAPKVLAPDLTAALEVCGRETQKLLDLLALRRKAPPRLLGGVVGIVSGPGELHPTHSWIEGPNYTGNLVGGDFSGESPHSLLLQWDGLSADPRARLWLSLHRDAIADQRWDYSFFKCFNILEGIAAELIPRGATVLDTQGSPRLQDNGRDYTTDHARGKVYELLRMVARKRQEAETNFAGRRADGTCLDLWNEVGMWVEIRNTVAHRGSWEVPHATVLTTRQLATRAAIEAEIAAQGPDGSFGSGTWRVVRTIRGAVESTLFAALLGRL